MQNNNNKKTQRVVIVGGGSSGWIAAAYLNGALNQRGEKPRVDITVIESPDIPRISVGEATIPAIQHVLSVIGLNEAEFLQQTDATFKQSIKYCNWVKKDNTFYHHPFSSMRVQPLDFAAQRWLASDRSIPFMETCSAQPIICEWGLAPKMMGEWRMGPPLTYAYHMDAQKFADYLRDFSKARGVRHIAANMTDVSLTAEGSVSSVNTDCAGEIEGDLFIDCTGFRAKLIEEQLQVGWDDCSQWLLCDRAVTMHLPYDRFYPGEVRPYTTATALSNGWVWDIPMQSRRSVGYVHSSAYISKQDAEAELRAYQGGDSSSQDVRFIDFKVGRRRQNWVNNVVAVGLSGGFIEPLESTGLYLSELGVVALAEYFPWQASSMQAMSERYNRVLQNRYYEILDFINMHYCLTQRDDTEFWREVRKPQRINPRLQQKLALWQHKPPTFHDFQDQCFGSPTAAATTLSGDDRAPIDTAGLWNHESYQCILYGMHYDGSFSKGDQPPRVPKAIIQRLQMARQMLPPHAYWLQQKVGMANYATAHRPPGWV
ncbi:tryptophan halogenase family protein [Idiomarina aquatica]|uniref:Tryptophan 7-halogenase n=1 Tax=Idiomarina aquatica TaxID=1327752 RepID=A0AA94EH33_9GAMM|nr:tryptophan halogenase family protein [Idiomarina aquatica]RUO44855.1 tryptophan 7-halogenase [Idiomarina aquatica]